uniref:Uncharacterized protein MANES_08G069600 n=1 Tax=Rhizophora mucronata TaxID=61149 RepID=A0A2P2LZ76_RHIMU
MFQLYNVGMLQNETKLTYVILLAEIKAHKQLLLFSIKWHGYTMTKNTSSFFFPLTNNCCY